MHRGGARGVCMVACLDNGRRRKIRGANPCFDIKSQDLLGKALGLSIDHRILMRRLLLGALDSEQILHGYIIDIPKFQSRIELSRAV